MNEFFTVSVLEKVVILIASLHFVQLPAMFIFAPKLLNWAEDISKMSLINQAIVKVMGGGIMIAGVGLGCVVLVSPGELLGPSILGRALCGFLVIFWAYRALVQIFLYPRIFPKGWMGLISHYGLACLFSFQTAGYLLVFFSGFFLGRK